MSQVPTILFLHIPRAGGTTLRRILAEYYDSGARIMLNRYPHNLSPQELADRLERIRNNENRPMFVHGQPDRFFCYWEYARSMTEHYKLLLLREPVSRIISQYKYYSAVHKTDISLQEYIRRFAHMRNYQTKVVSTLVSFDNHEYFQPDSSVDKALENLTMDNVVFGLTEYYEETLNLINSTLEFDISRYKTYNRSKEWSFDADSETISRIRSLNSLDMELYERAMGLFRNRLRCHSIDCGGIENVVDHESFTEHELKQAVIHGHDPLTTRLG